MNSTDPAHSAPAGPCLLVIFGASGDLTKRLLLPSLYNLGKLKLLPANFAIYGFAADQMDKQAFDAHIDDSLKQFAGEQPDQAIVNWLKERAFYMTGRFDDDAALDALKAEIGKVEDQYQTGGNRLFYFATAPRFIAGLAGQLRRTQLSAEQNGGPWRRVIVEKPFGRDLASAKALNKQLAAVLGEDQIYRIDHYLGKETVQNITVFRFANSVFEPMWNRSLIESIQITAAETIGVEHRGGYFEKAGALRDMVPNHLAQLLSLIAMEPPISLDANNMRDKQAELLHAVRSVAPENVPSIAVRGQYGTGEIDGKPVPAYRDEPDVAHDSNTETYVALKLMIDNWRWADVPFYLRTGKRLGKAVTEILVKFRRTPLSLFSMPDQALDTNCILIRIQPEQGICLSFATKAPGPVTVVQQSELEFDFAKSSLHGTGYERLLHDCMLGDATLFQRADMVEAGWSMVQPVLDAWQAPPSEKFPNYNAGSFGPAAANDLLARDGHHWRNLE